MEILNASDLLDFTLDEEDQTPKTNSIKAEATTAENGASFSEFVEEDLEWLSNKDAFPSVDTCFGILSDNLELISNHHSPVSVLENNTNTIAGFLKVPRNFPARPRSKSRRRKRATGFCKMPSQQVKLSDLGRRCSHCQADKTPQWRAGPMGPKTLCNACGVRYKSGRLVPEYRPANSPTFSSALHSNSHRKVVEMRRKKYLKGAGSKVSEACGYRVG